MEFYNTVYEGRDRWYYSGNGKARVDFDSQSNRSVKAELQIDFYPTDIVGVTIFDSALPYNAFTLKRAAVKVNLGQGRLTLGKTRLSWGPSQSVIFNSGDVLFGSRNPFVDFSQTGIRDDTAWITAFNYSIGLLSFVEGVVLAPQVHADLRDLPDATKTSGGIRGKFSIGNWWIEPGIFYKGEKQTVDDDLGIRPYLSIEGNWGPNWYFAISTAIDPTAEDFSNEMIAETTNFSFGVVKLFTRQNSTTSLRLEMFVQPWQEWNALPISELQAEGKGYGILLYPEIIYTYGSSYVYGLQAILSPVDGSGRVSASFGWYIFQGLYWVNYVSLDFGNSEDLFAWDRSSQWPTTGGVPLPDSIPNGKNITTGLRYVY